MIVNYVGIVESDQYYTFDWNVISIVGYCVICVYNTIMVFEQSSIEL